MARVSSLGARLIGLTLVAAAATGGVLVYRSLTARHVEPPPAAPPSAVDDPRVTWKTPFRNVRPEVAYVGDVACVECHREIAGHYAKHPMGRALALAADKSQLEPRGPEAHNPFEKFGSRFSVEYRDGKVYHREERLDAAGKPVAAIECEAKYALGSGTRGKSYIVDRDGRLFQSPISWFAEKQIWDLSPGFPDDMHFNRPIIPACLYCHCNQADAIDGPTNSYREPIFHGLAIGCERCHGPGQLHVKLRETGDKVGRPDYSIVNPRHLAPDLAEMVCQQCHLQGQARVLRRGRDTFDFRPGMPLNLFWSVFVRIPDLTPSFRSVGQTEQIHRSRCFQASGGKLQCISCHDPHRRPEAEQRVAFYRGRCLECHQSHGCALPAAERLKQQPDDSCIACHMSKAGSRNIPHTAVTDHRILRRPDHSEAAKPRSLALGEMPIVNFHAERTELDPREANRDLGLALARLNSGSSSDPSGLGLRALSLLDEAARTWPDDALVWETRAGGLGRLQESLESYQKALALNPKLERPLLKSAEICEHLQRRDEALAYRRRLLEVNPFVPSYHVDLARLYAQRGEWVQSLAAVEAALKLEPINTDARMLRVTCLVRTGNPDRAKAEFDTLIRMRPPDEAALRRAFANLTN